MSQAQDPEELYARLMEERPKLHGVYDWTTVLRSAACDWGLDPAVLRWLIAHIRSSLRTLETGCGYSTSISASTTGAGSTGRPLRRSRIMPDRHSGYSQQ